MPFSHFSHNGKLKPVAEAVIPLADVEYSYGFGVYESLRVTNGRLLFAGEHYKRLMQSAEIIGLEHGFNYETVESYVLALIDKNEVETCNVKILLIGGRDADSANLYIMCLNPLFPDRKLYRDGAHAVTQNYERPFPHAKTLNMLPSYLAYRQAKKADAYDALLINKDGNIVEGTRTNFFAFKDQTLYSPPEEEILLGVTRDHVLEVARKQGFEIKTQPIKLDEIDQYDGAFLTSTSSKIMPLKSIDDHQLKVTDQLKELILAFDKFLKAQA